ncbi:MAG: tetrahydrofolate dehydrogenase/cyclohydrolase catalytic domain-containing protein [Coriobacteriia bacterium]|nr:tetrahydrofolate dehydrogenase/cyclohydrolase catalytic domain-containing protein [Coriobacteriia bacterium]
MAEQLLGKKVVAEMKERIIARVEALKEQGVEPLLAFVRVGDRGDDLSYQRTATKRAESHGIATREFVLPATATDADVAAVLEQVNQDPAIHGCLMFRPLPKPLDNEAAAALLDPAKDIDGITEESLGAVFMDADQGFPPCTAQACVEMLDSYGIAIEGKHVVVIGRSLVIGKPVSLMLLRRNATVTMAHSRTKDLAALTRQADVVVCATGRAKAYGAEFFAPGQTVLDVGINFDAEGNLCGDVDFAQVEPVVAAITPVPGGIGSVTTECLMDHVVTAAERAAQR